MEISRKLDGTNEEFISVLNYLMTLFLLQPNPPPYEVIYTETNQIIKVLALEFGEFLQIILIWTLIIVNLGTNQTENFSEITIYIFGGC